MRLYPIDPDKPKRGIKYATADIEAYNWIKFLCVGFYDGNEDHYEKFEKLSDFVDYCYDYCKRKKIKHIFVHFGGIYDFSFFLGEIAFNPKYQPDNIIPRGSSILSFDVNKISANNNPDDFTLTFRDSSALLPFSLARLGESLDVDVVKDTMDFENMKMAWDGVDYTHILCSKRYDVDTVVEGEKVTTQELQYEIEWYKSKVKRYFDKKFEVWHEGLYSKPQILDYMEKDCVSLWQVVEKFYSWDLIQKAGPTTTTASQAVKIWRMYFDKPIESISTPNVDEFIRKDCYFGGRTEVFRPLFDGDYDLKKNPAGFNKENIKIIKKQQGIDLEYADVNSLYPTVMQTEDFPTKFKYWSMGFGGYAKDINNIGFWDVEVEVPYMLIPPLPLNHTFKNKQKKLIFPIGTFRGKWSTHELEYAKTLGVKITKVYQGAVFENGGKIFKNFITDLYNIRLKAKADGDSVGDVLSKLIMNSCYGRLGLQVERTNLIIDDGSLGLTMHSEVHNSEGQTIRFMERNVTLDKSFTNVAISAMVTSYARVLMHKLIYQVGPENVYYMDTDSLFIDKTWKYGNQLGELKLEYKCRSSVFLLPKTYINDKIIGEDFSKKLTMKGFDKKKIQHFTFDNFKECLAGEMSILKISQGPKFATFKTALRNNSFLMMNYDPETKRKIDEKKERDYFKKYGKKRKFVKKSYEISERAIKSRYDKRLITNQGLKSEPLILNHNREVDE